MNHIKINTRSKRLLDLKIKDDFDVEYPNNLEYIGYHYSCYVNEAVSNYYLDYDNEYFNSKENNIYRNFYYNGFTGLPEFYKKIAFLCFINENYDFDKMNPIVFIQDCIMNRALEKHKDLVDEFIEYENKVDKDGFVYIMEDSTDLYKIGFSKNPEERLNQCKTANPRIKIYQTYYANKFDEKFLHKIFDKKRYDREWFKLDYKDLIFINKYFFNQNQ